MPKSLYEPKDAKGLCVYLEQNQGRLESVSLELLGKSRELADSAGLAVTGLLLGHEVEGLAPQAIAAGADKVVVAQHALLRMYTTSAYSKVATQLILDKKPDILLLGATPNGRDLAGRVAVRLRTGITADCTNLELKPGGLLSGEVTGFGGGVLACIECPDHRPQMATVRPGVFPGPEPDPKREGRIEKVAPELSEADMTTQIADHVTQEMLDISRAPIIVAAGRGCHGDFSLINELAALLSGQVGVTRVAVDEGWVGRDRQIGQTGFICRPKLAIVCGASGAFQFTVGIEKAEIIVAINDDAEAPIFEASDYCVVGDLFRMLPPLVEAIKDARGNGGQANA